MKVTRFSTVRVCSANNLTMSNGSVFNTDLLLKQIRFKESYFATQETYICDSCLVAGNGYLFLGEADPHRRNSKIKPSSMEHSF